MPSSLGSWKKRELKSPKITFLKFTAKLFDCPFFSSVCRETSWKPWVSFSWRPLIFLLMSESSPSFSIIHFFSFNTNDEGLNRTRMPSVNVVTSAKISASFKVISALVLSDTNDWSLWEVILSRVLGKCKLSFNWILLIEAFTDKVSLLPLPNMSSPEKLISLIMPYGIRASIRILFIRVSTDPETTTLLNPPLLGRSSLI